MNEQDEELQRRAKFEPELHRRIQFETILGTMCDRMYIERALSVAIGQMRDMCGGFARMTVTIEQIDYKNVQRVLSGPQK